MWWLFSVLSACTTAPALPAHTAPFQLVRVFDDDHWLQPPPATPAPVRTFSEGFEDETLHLWKSKGKDRSAVSRVAEGVEGAWALQLTPSAEGEHLPPLFRRIEVLPDRTYRVSVQVRTEDLGAPGRESEGATLALVERTRSGALLRHNTLSRLRGDTAWRTLSTTFHTNAGTEELELRLVPATGRTQGRVLFDGVAVDLLDPVADLARIPAWTEHARPTPHPNLRGVTHGPDFRPAIVHATPASWGFAVDVPDEGATLSLAWALGAGSDAEARVCFSVRWADRRVAAELWQACLQGDEGRRWTDLSLPLDRDGTLIFQATTEQPEHTAHALWGDVRVRVPEPAGPQRPNVAIVVLDTLRADHLGAYGYSARPTSPALDAFAAQAIRFTQARASSPWTAPSLGTVVTGRYPADHRAGTRVLRELEVTKKSAGQHQKNTLNYTPMSLEHPTIGERFTDAGYETIGFQSNYFYSPLMGFARGFGRLIQYKGSSLAGARNGLDLARDWLAVREEDTPFLLSAHFIDPHMPYRMRRPWSDGFTPPDALQDVDHDPEKSALILREFTEGNRPQTDAIETLYDADIRWLDDALGGLLPLLIAQDALIIVLSDHGEAFNEHGQYSHGHGLYDELLRVPLMVRLPGGVGAGTVDERPVGLVDVLPTVLARAGLDVPEGLSGLDLLDPDATREGPLVLEAMYSGRDRSGLTDGRWKYIYTHPRGYLGFNRAGVKPSGSAHNAGEELFDLAVDPGERKNLAAQEPERVLALRAQVHDRLQRTWPGLHLRCEGVGETLTVEIGETIGQISPFTVEPTDRIELAQTRDSVTLGLGEDTDWLAFRLLQDGATVSVTGAPVTAGGVAGTRWTLGTGELPSGPPLVAGPGCQVWEVPFAAGEDQELDDETFAELEALGYIE